MKTRHALLPSLRTARGLQRDVNSLINDTADMAYWPLGQYTHKFNQTADTVEQFRTTMGTLTHQFSQVEHAENLALVLMNHTLGHMDEYLLQLSFNQSAITEHAAEEFNKYAEYVSSAAFLEKGTGVYGFHTAAFNSSARVSHISELLANIDADTNALQDIPLFLVARWDTHESVDATRLCTMAKDLTCNEYVIESQAAASEILDITRLFDA